MNFFKHLQKIAASSPNAITLFNKFYFATFENMKLIAPLLNNMFPFNKVIYHDINRKKQDYVYEQEQSETA